MKLCADKQCRRLGQKLRLSMFTKNKNMKDGRGSYCKECFLRRVHKYRTGLRAKKAAEKARRHATDVERKPMAISPLLRVKAAVDCGHRTREQIEAATELEMDQICDALAELAFDYQSVRIVNLGSEKVFIPRAA